MPAHVMPRRDSLSLDDKRNEDLAPKAVLRPNNADFLEAQAPHEYGVSKTRKLMFLSLYFMLNLGLTLSNKRVLQVARYPWLLTSLHAATTSAGCLFLQRMGYFQCTKLSSRDSLVLIAFSGLFTANIATSNASL